MTSDNTDFTSVIPDYLNDLLDEPARTEFESALKNDPALQLELEEFKELQTFYKDALAEEEPPSEPIFSRITDEIEAIDASVTENRQPVPFRTSISRRVVEVCLKIKESVTIPWGLALVQAAVIVLLVVSRPPEQTFKTLGAHTTPHISIDNEQVRLNIVFDESAHEVDIRTLLLQINGTIVNGPSPQGKYQVRVEKKISDQTLIKLQQSELTNLVEQAM